VNSRTINSFIYYWTLDKFYRLFHNWNCIDILTVWTLRIFFMYINIVKRQLFIGPIRTNLSIVPYHIIDILRYWLFSFIIWLIMHNIEFFIRNDAFTMTYFNSNCTRLLLPKIPRILFWCFGRPNDGLIWRSNDEHILSEWLTVPQRYDAVDVEITLWRLWAYHFYSVSYIVASFVSSSTMFYHCFYSTLNT